MMDIYPIDKKIMPISGAGMVSAFSLIELLTVIAVVAILATILVPVVGSIGQSSHQAECASNMRQIHAAVMLYVNDNDGHIVSGHSDEPGNSVVWSDGWHKDRWESPLASYVGGKDAWGRIVVCPGNRTDEPVEKSPGGLNVKNDYGFPYIINYNVMAPYGYPRRNMSGIADPSRVVMLVDSKKGVGWTRGFTRTSGAGWDAVDEKHGGTVNVLWVDGHVSSQHKHTIEDNIQAE